MQEKTIRVFTLHIKQWMFHLRKREAIRLVNLINRVEKISQVSACAAKDLFITISGNVSYKALTCDDTIIKTDVGTVLIKHGNLCKYQIAPYIFQYLLPG